MILAEIVLRVRLTSGDQLDVTYEEPGALAADEVLEHVLSARGGTWPDTALIRR